VTPSPPIFRQRLPFFGLLLAAITGILAGEFSGSGSVVFFAAAVASLVAWMFFRRSAVIYFAVACAFACAHVWQSTESPAWRLAERIGSGRVLGAATGRIVSDASPFGKDRVRVVLRTETIEIGGNAVPFASDLSLVLKAPAPGRGDTIRVVGGIEAVEAARNPAAFDARAWMRTNGITCEITAASAADVEILRRAPWYSLPAAASRSRAWMERTLRAGIGDDPAVCDLLAGMVLGVTASIPDSLQQEFRNTGTFHLFSVSGLHVGMIGLILWQALKIAGVSRRWSVPAIIPALLFYALITGWKPSSVRAAEMSSIFLIGLVASRRPMPFNSLCAAGFLILAGGTTQLFNPGFQLSFLVVAAILLLAVPLHRAIRDRVHPDPFVPRQIWTPWQKLGAGAAENLGGLVAVSLAAWVGSLPLTVYYFHMVSLSALPANLAVVPTAFLIMATACLALFGGLFSLSLAAVFNNANLVFTHVLLLVVQLADSLPGSHFYVGLPESAPVVITVFDFGAGGGAAVESGGKIWLIDCGPAWAFGSVVTPWLRSRGTAAPEGIVLSHGDARHIGAASGIMDLLPRPLLVESDLDDRSPVRGRLHQRLAELGIPKSLHRAGDRVAISPGVALEILYPLPGITENESDDKVLVVRLVAGTMRVIFLSDAGPTAQARLVEIASGTLAADILVAGRHRSGVPVSAGFLDAVCPSLLVTSAAGYPETEIPDPDWIAMVEQRGIRVFRQDVSGAVRIEIFPNGFVATGFADGAKFRK
jgi:ComEC/Rec2-related protein